MRLAVLTFADKRSFLIGFLLLSFVAAVWVAGFLYAPVDANQGEVYRIIFLHVPCAVAAFTSSLGLPHRGLRA